MPNHCDCDLTVSGPKKDLSIFKTFAEGKDPWNSGGELEVLCAAKFIEPPQEAIDDYQKVGYEWCCCNWGTKWGMYDVTRVEKPRSLVYHFQSAWAPPIPVIAEMADRFPSLRMKLKYFEGGMGFQGKMVFKDKEIITDEHNEYTGWRGG